MNIAILGFGTVGRGVDTIISESMPTIFVKKILELPDRLSDPRMTSSFDEILEDSSIEIVVECMGGIEPARTYILACLAKGKSVVSSNKAVLAAHLEDFVFASQKSGASLMYEASVCGGIPWISSITQSLRTDTISEFWGVMNGSTNYILTSMESLHSDFTEALKEAQMLGYAERNPKDDIEGIDVKNKTIITASVAFGIICTHDFPVSGISMVKQDDLAWASSNGRRIKLFGRGICTDSSYAVSVEAVCVPKTRLEAHVDKNFNCATITCKYAGDLMFYGQGAGSLPTAHAIVQDLCCCMDQSVPSAGDFSRTLRYDPNLLRSDYVFFSAAAPKGMDPVEDGTYIIFDISSEKAFEILRELRDHDPMARSYALL